MVRCNHAFNRPRRDQHHFDVEWGQFDAQEVGQGMESTLGGRVDAVEGSWRRPSHRANVDYETGSSGRHARHNSTGKTERGESVDIEAGLDLVQAHV